MQCDQWLGLHDCIHTKLMHKWEVSCLLPVVQVKCHCWWCSGPQYYMILVLDPYPHICLDWPTQLIGDIWCCIAYSHKIPQIIVTVPYIEHHRVHTIVLAPFLSIQSVAFSYSEIVTEVQKLGHIPVVTVSRNHNKLFTNWKEIALFKRVLVPLLGEWFFFRVAGLRTRRHI